MRVRWNIAAASLLGMLCGITAIGQSDVVQEFKSAQMRRAQQDFMASRDKARSSYVAAVDAARKEYSEALEAGIRRCTRDGDLDEANALKAALDELAAHDFEEDLPSLWGTWRMNWGQTGTTPYQFHSNGVVTRDLRNEATRGVLRRIGRDLAVDFNDGSIFRVNLSGRRLLLEYWPTREAFGRDYPAQIGVGEPAL